MDMILHYFLVVVLVVLSLGILLGLIRAIQGPRMADRIVGINLIGSLSTASIAILAVILDEAWLLDVSLIYCFISFLTVIIIAKISVDNKLTEERRRKKCS